MQPLAGQAALVTGASRGIGKAIALHLAAAGVRVAVAARSAGDLDRVVDEIRGKGGDAFALPGTVTDPGLAAQIVSAAMDRFGALSLLVNNAGIPGPYGPVGTLDPLEWWTAQQVNVFAPFAFMNAAIPGMRDRRAGRIVNIVSNAALQPIPYLSAYAVSKNTVIRITETVDLELRESGVKAFALHPGNITTDMARGTVASADAQRWFGERIAMIRDRDPLESAADLKRCCYAVAAIAAGTCDTVSGRYLDLWKDIP